MEQISETGHAWHNYFLADPSITELLKAWRDGDETALNRLSERVYNELRQMARRHMRNERPDNTLQTTALVHEVSCALPMSRKSATLAG